MAALSVGRDDWPAPARLAGDCGSNETFNVPMLSSCRRCRCGECLVGVEQFAGLEAVVEASEQPVEQVTGCGGVTVAVDVSSTPVVLLGSALAGTGREGPHVAHCGEAIVFDPAVGDRQASPGGAGNRCGPA